MGPGQVSGLSRTRRLILLIEMNRLSFQRWRYLSNRLGGAGSLPRTARADGLDKFQRYRMARRMRGMKLLRVWVPDPRAPGFQEEAHRQAMVLCGALEEADALDFIEAAADWRDVQA